MASKLAWPVSARLCVRWLVCWQGKLSIALLYHMLARDVLRLRNMIPTQTPWDVVMDLFLYRDPEELEDMEQAAATTEAAGGWGGEAPAPVVPAAAPAAEDWGSAPAGGAGDWGSAPAGGAEAGGDWGAAAPAADGWGGAAPAQGAATEW
jgi:small subunit ribosomal protein SAe